MSQVLAPSSAEASFKSSPVWIPLSKLDKQFAANLAALQTTDPQLATQLAAFKPEAEYFLRAQDDTLILGRARTGVENMELLSNAVPANRAREIAGKIYPDGNYNQPLLITGLDQGWLWEAIYKLPCKCAFAPGFKFPLYLMASQVERLWAVLHYQNWSAMLAEARVRIFAGPDSVVRFEQLLKDEPRLCAPQMTVTIEQQLWQDGKNLDAVIQSVAAANSARLSQLQRELSLRESSTDLGSIPDRLRHGLLRVLGITSRYTTFLQHSMRDWLAAFESAGHTTSLLIERADHESQPGIVIAEECLNFRPDLILIIDHYRGEMPGLPRGIPCVMWVQDRLPNIYSSSAGHAQDTTDFVIGYGRQECTQRLSYPASRFMPAMVGVNEKRFTPRTLSREDRAKYECDVAFVSHASEPPERIIQNEIQRAGTEQAKRLLTNIHERLAAIYESGGSITAPGPIESLIESAMSESGVNGDFQAVQDLVTQRVNNAFLRHQSVAWIAATGADIRLYGRGWEQHPRFAKYARGIADNQEQLSTIYQASRVNLQVTPFGAAHQRLFEGLACGGFFLLRAVTGDAIDLLKREMWYFLRRNQVNSAPEMMTRCAKMPTFQWMISGLNTLLGADTLADPNWLFSGLEEAALGGFSRCASTLWPEYERVSFWTQTELTDKLKYFLGSSAARSAVAESMREQVLRWHTYSAISSRMLTFMADELTGRAPAAIAA
jgi:hypothetical protein